MRAADILLLELTNGKALFHQYKALQNRGFGLCGAF